MRRHGGLKRVTTELNVMIFIFRVSRQHWRFHAIQAAHSSLDTNICRRCIGKYTGPNHPRGHEQARAAENGANIDRGEHRGVCRCGRLDVGRNQGGDRGRQLARVLVPKQGHVGLAHARVRMRDRVLDEQRTVGLKTPALPNEDVDLGELLPAERRDVTDMESNT